MRAFSFHAVVITVITSVLLGACGGGGDQPTTGNTPQANGFVAGVVMAMNDVNSRTPADFYHLEGDGTDNHEYFHIRSDQLWPATSTRYDLATGDPYEAAAWSQQLVLQRHPLATLQGNKETRWYYESLWHEDDPYGLARTIHARVYKADMIDRSVYDAAHPSDLLAVVHQNVTPADIEWISEYLWTFSENNRAGHRVLSSETSVSNDGYVHIISEAVYDAFATDRSGCLAVQLWDDVYAFNAMNGGITLQQKYKGSLEVKRTANGYVQCQTDTVSGSTGMQQVYPD